VTTAVAPLERLSFAVGDWLTDGQRLIQVTVILSDGDVLVEDAKTNVEEPMPALALMENWRQVKPQADAA
jgi:hypothetical protein